MVRLERLFRSREGAAALVVALAFAVLSNDGPRDVVASPVRFLIALPVAALAMWLLARSWESRTWPAAPAFAQRPATTSGARMLREDTNATVFSDRRGFLFRQRHFFTATGLPPVLLDDERVAAMWTEETHGPVEVASSPERTWWWFGESFYWENAGYNERDVHALIARRERRHAQELQRAHTLLEVGRAGPRREGIPQDVRRAVFERDGGRCVQCDATFDLQYDHVIPVAHGGATSVENLQLLCGSCNREKSATI